jgi:hypothetical protein
MPFAGFDVARYPGDTVMQSLWKNSNLYWVGFYLAVGGAGLGDKQTWSGKFDNLKRMGWGVAPIYVGKQPNSAKLALKRGQEELEGYLDGVEAAALASREGMPGNTVLYFDLEMPDITSAWKDYYFGWTKAVDEQGYSPGLYCSYLCASRMAAFVRERDADLTPELWTYNLSKFRGHLVFDDITGIAAPDPAGSGAAATSWQYVQGSRLSWPGNRVTPVDLDSSVYTDPGQRVVSELA